VRVEIAVRVEPDQPQFSSARRAQHRTQRQTMVAAQNQRDAASLQRLRHLCCQHLPDRYDRLHVLQARIARLAGFADRHLEIAMVYHAVAKGLQALHQPSVAQRARTHIDATPACSKIQGYSDQVDLCHTAPR